MFLRIIGLLLSLISPQLIGAQANFKSTLKAHRLAYQQSLVGNENAPLDSAGIKGVRFFRPKKTYQVTGTFVAIEDAVPFKMPTYTGEEQAYIAYGKVLFEWRNQAMELTLYRNLRLARIPMFRDRLFLPFKDETNLKSTYGGGRYLDLNISDIQDEKLTLDFNKAYNPYCAFSDGFSCPIPPAENHLPLEIKAGEKSYQN